MPVYRLGRLPAGARYRTSDAVESEIQYFHAAKYDKKLNYRNAGEQSLSVIVLKAIIITAKMIIIMKEMWFENIINIPSFLRL